jgi:ParB-like chromosome segregation protein Spo0J
MTQRKPPKVSGLLSANQFTPAASSAVAHMPPLGSRGLNAIGDTLDSIVSPSDQISSSNNLLLIPLAKLKIHPFNSRTVRSQERIEEVRGMLEEEHIQREPITVVPGRHIDDSGFYYILSGQTRFHAANLAGWNELLAQINNTIDPDDHLAFWKASIEHNTAKPETDWDLAVKARALFDKGVTSEQIQAATRRDERGVRRILAMTELPESAVTVVKEHADKLSAPFCEILKSKITELGDEVVARLAKETVEQDWSQRNLKDYLERAIRQKSKQSAGGSKRATRRSISPIMVGTKKAGAFKVMQSRIEGKMLITLAADLPEELVEAFTTDIQAALDKLAMNK